MGICRVANPVALAVTIMILMGCGTGSPRFASSPSVEPWTGSTELEGVASYYAHEFDGRTTANGEVYDMNALTAAHRSFPFGTLLRITNVENGKSVVVRVNDRGPFVEGRIIDLSLGAAKAVGMIQHGTTMVKIDILQLGGGSGQESN